MHAVANVDLKVSAGEILGLVGELGSGKSALALSILRLIDAPGEIASGEILFEGRDILKMRSAELRQVRGRGIGMIFQQPQSCLNPVRRVGWHIAETAGAAGRARATCGLGRALASFCGQSACRGRKRRWPIRISFQADRLSA